MKKLLFLSMLAVAPAMFCSSVSVLSPESYPYLINKVARISNKAKFDSEFINKFNNVISQLNELVDFHNGLELETLVIAE